MSISNIFEELRSTSSRLEKEAILKRNANNKVLERVFYLALDPYTQFYQRKIPDYTPARKNQADSLDSVMSSLSMLSTRQVTGNAAVEYLSKLLSSLVYEDAEILECIIQKDPDCGVQVSTVNKIWPNLVTDYPCMLCSVYDEKTISKFEFPAIVQLKMDGMRFNAIVDLKKKSVAYRSRNGKEVAVNNDMLDTAFLTMAKNIGQPSVVFDGELVVVSETGKLLDRKTGNGILNKAVKGTIIEDEKLMVRATLWDMIPLKNFQEGKWNTEYKARFKAVTDAVNSLGGNLNHLVSIVETKVVNELYGAQRLFEKYHAAGEEGIILKSMSGIWENKRTKSQVKFKGELECDLVCVEWEEGDGKYKGKLGALVLESSDGLVRVSVGTGLTDEMRNLKPKDVKGKIVTIKYNARITNKNRDGVESLFLPVFLEIREDKTKADSSKKIK